MHTVVVLFGTRCRGGVWLITLRTPKTASYTALGRGGARGEQRGCLKIASACLIKQQTRKQKCQVGITVTEYDLSD